MKRHQCGTAVRPEDLSAHDQNELKKFEQFLLVGKARKEGADPSTCDMLEAAIYPEGIGRENPKGDA